MNDLLPERPETQRTYIVCGAKVPAATEFDGGRILEIRPPVMWLICQGSPRLKRRS
jgi:hypothetical protein